MLLGLLLVNQYAQGPLSSSDQAISQAFHAFRTPFLTAVSLCITLFAQASTILPLSVLLLAFLYIRQQRWLAIQFTLSMILSESFTFLGKLFFHRERPDELFRLLAETSYAFPSGHATTAAAFYGCILLLILRSSKQPLVRALAIIKITCLVLAIGLSRIYLGVHYPTDVIAGIMIGALGVLVSIPITNSLFADKPANPTLPISISAVLLFTMISITLVALTFLSKAF